jgi:hypothetical protein
MTLQEENKKLKEALTMLVEAKERKESHGKSDPKYLAMKLKAWPIAQLTLAECEENENTQIEIIKKQSLPACEDGCCHEDGFIVKINDYEHYFLTEQENKIHKEIQYLIEYIIDNVKRYNHGYKFKLS